MVWTGHYGALTAAQTVDLLQRLVNVAQIQRTTFFREDSFYASGRDTSCIDPFDQALGHLNR